MTRSARTLTDADVDAIADAVAARLRAHAPPAARRAREAGRARLSPAEAARRAAESAGEVDDLTRARVARALRKAGR